ncbi:phospholipase D delta isoform X1 [Cryptomeria japonica]|uniref:phospholipase D delta isoform X1 n=1 Tax=Cryptomeria japonica TaxID=3369 RepID=UPI0027DA75BE|nr:phospholipase D delta isoform X1 [Cryptomeria japonica]XP_057832451.2 phospholipase D delta isoform X1 [Cryptomeria japonica]XP_057832452.2 phospholipase D delta isoform X1 [Cryptomeria japonica]XP_057832453.2 phospholipase D delta isoform X1 [Cryptomeria japonica]XP_059077304.1 phospholipase D delta isoform X1 [Cryptomeria japonica]
MADIGSFNGTEKMEDVSLKKVPSQKKVLLHGTLDVWIFEAKDLPNMDMMSERARQFFTFFNSCGGQYRQKNRQRHHHKIITSDPYVSVQVAGATVAQTRIITNSQLPKWDEHFTIHLAHFAGKVEFLVKDNDLFGAQLIGTVAISAEEVLSGEKTDDWFPVLNSYGKPPKPDSALRLSLQFAPVQIDPLYKDGIGSGPDHSGVPHTYFPLRKGGMVSLYQDAHVRDHLHLPIRLDGGKEFERGRCWEDICHAILEAHHLVYITGWSIYHKIRLVKEPTKPLPEGGLLNLGELLKYKSQEGVRVLLLVWDDKTSHDKFLIKTEGVMQTHDEETKKFFKHSSVHCVLSPRYASSKLSWVKQRVVGSLYTHHQKSVIVDSQGPGNNRKLTAFIGGLDLCDGRYDTPEHRLFRDLQTDIFKEDYHNPTFLTNGDAGGPRQPWHDLHCKIDGPAAYDVLTNFEQRWRKATRWHEFGQRFKKASRWHDDALIKLDRISWILSPKQDVPDGDHHLWVSEEDDPENWHVQIFRSIDSGSVKFFAKNVKEAEAKNLICRKNLLIDKSIHTAYVKAIRSAQHFIYIENQYFLGSSYNWPQYRNAGANNLIPMELALKTADKIRNNERFSVYVVIPMWPEGVPNGAAVQEILFWQKETMEMMYIIISDAIKDAGLSETQHPQDYLNFYCLGNREAMNDNEDSLSNKPAENSPQGQAQKYRRFMIYVHAKGMIVDDEYVIIGSANINERSLDGSRDTEIAMGSYQPHHTWAQLRRHPHGQIYGYRKSLWEEHLGTLDASFDHPESLDCVQKVNEMAEKHWSQFTAEEVIEMKGHLLKYPVAVGADGKVGPLPGYENFPDVGGKIVGAPGSLPDTLTT